MKKKNLNELIEHLPQVDIVNTLGTPIYLKDNRVVIPINKVLYGYGDGQSEFHISEDPKRLTYEFVDDIYPYQASLGAAHVKPYALAVLDDEKIRIVKLENDSLYDKSLELIKTLITKRKHKE
ncbi:MAG TPA: hypothetical protein DCY93_00290 [Firmicutes bacterium]|nr:hypothetical protein [Bacillota bacterium]